MGQIAWPWRQINDHPTDQNPREAFSFISFIPLATSLTAMRRRRTHAYTYTRLHTYTHCTYTHLIFGVVACLEDAPDCNLHSRPKCMVVWTYLTQDEHCEEAPPLDPCVSIQAWLNTYEKEDRWKPLPQGLPQEQTVIGYGHDSVLFKQDLVLLPSRYD